MLVVASALAVIGSSNKLLALRRAARALGHRPAESPASLPGPDYSVTILVPARDEGDVLERTLLQLAASSYRRLRILAIVDVHDERTTAAAYRAAHAYPDRIAVMIEPPEVRIKAQALNAALAGCTDDIVGVFDADGIVHPGLVERVADLFTRHRLDALQVGNQPLAHRPRWYQSHNMVEFFAMFLASTTDAPRPWSVVRLSGNSVFLLRSTVGRVGGWDERCLAEDCELSLRLAAAGARVMVWYRPGLATIEESPRGLRAFVRQRSRWNQGFVQILSGRTLRTLRGRQRWEALRFLVETPGRAIVVATGGAGIALAGWHPGLLLVPAPAVVLGLVNTRLLATLHAQMPAHFPMMDRAPRSASLVLTAIAFQLVLCAAAIRALGRAAAGVHTWEKTVHTGADPTI